MRTYFRAWLTQVVMDGGLLHPAIHEVVAYMQFAIGVQLEADGRISFAVMPVEEAKLVRH